ncbi:MerR family transcriptional regulator [Actinomadura luteofluorescens]|uniref:MerR family transcriptional regulator n=1 Tax=Actinomadura luteofluorescens TaxID=46163 RepID=UPI00216463E3|nr:MerR family transcriptional regulator [Actinomadura glauciflava]MCR3739835.1 DNA-binding transcriptional regulator, MerR family [Actinomadura glauciflava]
MRIGELVGATGVSRRLLRYYEDQGLLHPARLANGYREYTDADVTAVRHIRALLTAGLPTTTIAQLLPCVHDEEGRMVPSSCPTTIARLRQEQSRITGAITRLRTAQQALDSILATALHRLGPVPADAAPPRS